VRRIYSLNTFGAFDLASSGKAKTDDYAGGVIGVDTIGRIFVFESFMKYNADPLECVEVIFNHILKYRCIEYCIERNRYEFLMPTIEKLLNKGYFNGKYNALDVRRAMGRISTPYRNRKEDNKKDRIEATLQPLVKTHSIFLHSSMTKEKRQFENYMVHDDFLDWLETAVSISYPPTEEIYQQEGVFREIDRAMAKKSINEVLAEKSVNVWTGIFN